MINLFIKTESQKKWLQQLHELESKFKRTAAQIDERAIFPKDNIQDLVNIGYTSITLPTAYGGKGLGVYNMVLFQETLASFDENTALSIGWNLGVVGDIFDKKHWDQMKLDLFAKEVISGALTNRFVREAQTGSPSKGGRPETTALRKEGHWILSGLKNLQQRLRH